MNRFSNFGHVFSAILLLSCAVQFTYGQDETTPAPTAAAAESQAEAQAKKWKCWEGEIPGDVATAVEDPAVLKKVDCDDKTFGCEIKAVPKDTDPAKITYGCAPQAQTEKCVNLIDSEEGKKGNVGPAICEKNDCNNLAFLKEACKGGVVNPPDDDNSTSSKNPGEPDPPKDNESTTTTAHFTRAPSYSTLFMAYAVILTVAGIINSKS